VDAAVMARTRIVLGGGSRSWKVLAPPSILLTIDGVEVVEGLATPASKPAEPDPPAEPRGTPAPATSRGPGGVRR
jgi:hypothetical protein